MKNYEQEVMDVLKEKDNVDNLIKDVTESFNKSIIKVESSNIIEDIKRELEKAEEEKENWINVANGKEKKKERVSIRRKRIEGKSLESKEQVEEYIKKLEKDIEDIKGDLLKAVSKNKRVDVY